MKNIFRILMAVAVLLTASCAKEDISSSIGGGEVEVTFTANLQDLGSRAYGDGSQVNTLRFSVYDAVSGEKLTQLCGQKAPISASTPTTVNLVLLKGMKYNITFWADCNKLYDFDGQVVTVDYDNVVANDEKRDAFYAYVKEFDPADANADTTIELYRPFAQLNAISTDAADALANSGVTISKSTVKAELYNSFNLTDGTVSNPVEKTLTAGDILSAELLSMNYLFAPAEGYTPNVTFTFENNKNIDFGASFSYVPLKRNYRTNIIGSLLTKPTDFTVEIEAGFNKADQVVATDAAAAQEALDNAVPGTVIKLKSGVNYGTLKIKAVEGNNNTTTGHDYTVYRTELLRTVKDLTILGAPGAKVDAIEINAGYIEGSKCSLVDINNLVIDGVEFTDVYTNAPHSYAAPIFADLGYINVNGLTVNNCKLIGNNNKINLVYLYGSQATNFTATAKNITITNNTVDGIARLCELRGTENVTISHNTIKNTALHGILLAKDTNGEFYSGNVTITENYAEAIHERFVRMAGAGDAVVVIKDNIISNYLGADADYIKVTDGTNVTIENNTLANSTTVTVPDSNTQDVVVSTGTTQVTVPAAAAQAGDNYKVVVSNENTATDSVTGETTVAFDLTLYKNDVKVSGDVVYAVTKNIGAGLFISEVTHNGTALTKATTGADQTYTYDAATGVLTIYTKSFSPFAVTHSTYKEYIRKLNRGHNINSGINISTGGDLLPIVAVMPEIFGYSVFDGDTRIANAVHFCISNVKKEAINENSYKVAVKVEVKDENGNDLELKSGSPYNTGKEYLNVYMNLIEIPTGYSISNVSVNGNAFTLTQNANGNPSTGEYWLGSDPKDVYIQSKTAGLIEITVAKVN